MGLPPNPSGVGFDSYRSDFIMAVLALSTFVPLIVTVSLFPENVPSLKLGYPDAGSLGSSLLLQERASRENAAIIMVEKSYSFYLKFI